MNIDAEIKRLEAELARIHDELMKLRKKKGKAAKKEPKTKRLTWTMGSVAEFEQRNAAWGRAAELYAGGKKSFLIHKLLDNFDGLMREMADSPIPADMRLEPYIVPYTGKQQNPKAEVRVSAAQRERAAQLAYTWAADETGKLMTMLLDGSLVAAWLEKQSGL